MNDKPMHSAPSSSKLRELASELPAFSTAALAALSEERARPAPLAAKDRVLERLSASAALNSSAGPSTAGAPAATAAIAPSALRAIAPLFGTLLIGLGGGFWIGQRWQNDQASTPTTASMHSAPTATTAAIAPPTLPTASAAPSTAVSAQPEKSMHPATTSMPATGTVQLAPSAAVSAGAVAPANSGADDALTQERSLLDRATLALRRGSANDALAAVSEHRARFPGGQFAEERDALEVHALRQAGKIWEASSAEAAFHKRYPKSALVPERP